MKRRMLAVLLVPFVLCIPSSARSAAPSEWVIEDFSDIVTAQDAGLNDFSGNMGVINKWDVPYGRFDLTCAPDGACPLRFAWDFTVSKDDVAFTGFFLSLFGLSDTRVSFDGRNVQSIRFDEHTLDLDRIDGALIEPGGPRRAKNMCFKIAYHGEKPLELRLELKDANGGSRYTRLHIEPSEDPQFFCWEFREGNSYRDAGQEFNAHKTKTLACVIEREHAGDAIRNPDIGAFEIHKVWLTPERPDAAPASEQELLDLVERRTLQYFLDWSSRKPGSRGIPQDRSTFGGLLTTAGIGYALPAYAIGAERGWLSREDAAKSALDVLRILDNPNAYGPEPTGKIGYQGWLYHFVGVNGKRYMNCNDPATAPDESMNTVELSTIDTGLALMGVLVAQNFFDQGSEAEREIRTRAQSIYNRVNWSFMLDPESKQFYLGWKPNEKRTGPAFAIPDADGRGCYSGTANAPATLDYYTDEAMIVSLLALGQKQQDLPDEIWTAWKRERAPDGFIRSYPGSLFTYQQLHAFLDTRNIVERGRDGQPDTDWFENSRSAMLQAITYASGTTPFKTYGPNAWGFSAAEGPYDAYRAYGIRPLAVNPSPDEDGTVSYYAMVSSISYGRDLRRSAVSAMRHAFATGQWHPRFGLPDAYNADIAQVHGAPANAYRKSGPWVQRALFAIDQGPMLLHIENARSGLVWRMLSVSPEMMLAVDRIRNPDRGTQVAIVR